jgi:hypothetical protein
MYNTAVNQRHFFCLSAHFHQLHSKAGTCALKSLALNDFYPAAAAVLLQLGALSGWSQQKLTEMAAAAEAAAGKQDDSKPPS